jgi:hypothetical protein
LNTCRSRLIACSVTAARSGQIKITSMEKNACLFLDELFWPDRPLHSWLETPRLPLRRNA